MKNKLLDMKTLKTLFLAVIIFYSKNINSQNTNFCYGSITVCLIDGGTAIMTRKGTSGNIVSKITGTYDLYGKGNSTETLQIRFKGIIYRYDLIRNGYGSPSVLIDNQGRKYDICSSSSVSYGGGLTMPKIVVAALPSVAQKTEYYLEKTKENVYVVKNKNTKKTMFYVVPDDLFYADKGESRLGFDKAKALVESLNKDNSFEWRLPTFSELEIIYNLKSKFEKRPSMEMYWTNTTSDNNPKTSFKCVNFTDGSIIDGLKYTSGRVGYGKSSYGYVFAVRDFISKDEKVSFKIPDNNDVYVHQKKNEEPKVIVSKDISKIEEKNGIPLEQPIVKKEVPASLTAKIVLDNYIKAIGGEKAVASVKTLMIIGLASIPQAPAQLIFTNKVDSRGKLLIEISMAGMSLMKQLVNEKEAYVVQQGQTKKIEGNELVEMKASAIPFEELLLTDKKDLLVSGIETINGNDAYGIANGKTTLYYDVKSGLKVARITTLEQDGNKITQTTNFKDYREVKGVKVPFNIIQNAGAEFDIKMSEVKINEGVFDSDFQ